MTIYQIPRNSLAWMLAAQAAVILPHVTRLPLWVTGVCLACGFWRVMVYQGRWSFPGRWTKTALVVVGFVGVPFGYGSVYGVEPAVALLIVAFALKLLEMHHKRDAYVVILLAYFVAITEFLFFQTIPYTLYMAGCVVMITAALIGLHQTRSHLEPLKTLRTALVLLGQSVPLMIVLFILFPRISPLWTVPLPTEMARTGVSDSMSPGDFAELTQSDELAFKATFESEPPPFARLYWRGLVLTEFNGRTWSQNEPLLQRSVWRHRQKEPGWNEFIEYGGNEQKYSVILEPTQQHWIFSLAIPELPVDRDLVMLRDYRIASTRPIRQKLRYELTSHMDYVIERELAPFWQYRYTRLPEEGNPRAKELALTMFREVGGNHQAYISSVLRMYNLREFVYTLKPPRLGEDSIDEFLLDTRRGFCEHYAGSFVYLMRSAGIPARVVVGYQGGEYNPNGNYVSVRQFDAHAWSEVWLEDLGWVRIDPTSAVAPDRVERGLEAAVEEEDTFLADSPLSIFRYRQLLWLTELRLQIDGIGHYWDTWVVGYTPETQMSLLARYLGDVDRKRLGMIMLAVFFSVLGVIAIILLSRRSKPVINPSDAAYLKFCGAMANRGLPRHTGEGPLDYAKRVAAEYPDLKPDIDWLTDEFVQLNYEEAPGADTGRLKRAVRAFRLRVMVGNV